MKTIEWQESFVFGEKVRDAMRGDVDSTYFDQKKYSAQPSRFDRLEVYLEDSNSSKWKFTVSIFSKSKRSLFMIGESISSPKIAKLRAVKYYRLLKTR